MPKAGTPTFLSLIIMSAKNLFNIPYAGVNKDGSFDLLIGLTGEYSVVIEMNNPVTRYSADSSGYEEYHHLLINIVKILGEGHLLQKHDIISRYAFRAGKAKEYLQRHYNAHFEGRECLGVKTYLTITKQVRKGAFYTFDTKAMRDFLQVVGKVLDVLPSAQVLNEGAINQLVLQMLSMNFNPGQISLNNLSPTETEVNLGNRAVRSISLINIDSIDLPPDVSTHIELNDKESTRGFPIDFLSFLFKVPACDAVVYNQVIEIPNQVMTLRKLEQKKKRHAGIPDPANQLCVEDIDLLLTDVARENQLLVNAHFNIMVCAQKETLHKAANFVESSLFQLGIIPSKNAYNQLELFRTALPGNGGELKVYDWFLTTCDAAMCFFFKESLPKDEPSDFLLRFTDRQGIPIGIDPADLPMRIGRINNRNKFVLGPSGSGKSFFMNALIEQYMLYNMDVVIVDTGHSYSGLCAYYNGKYITYTDTSPITMNPFKMTEKEYNIEKKDFLCTLIGVAWKGAEGILTPVERDVIANVISAYYATNFPLNGELKFDTFYDFALQKIPEIKKEEKIVFDFDEFRYVLKKFYKGGEFATMLNKETDKSLFTERFIVYEIDSIKGAHVMAA
jgi:conjugation system TraG family ATPase